MTSEKCTQILNELPHLDRSGLQRLWQDLLGAPPHPKLRRELMVPVLAYRVQEGVYGGLKASTRKYLRKIASEIASGKPISTVPRIKPGAKLLREWHSERHEVTVTQSGYSYKGKEYKTLSEIARLITGSRWSGPLFFGLRKRGRGQTE